jgi:hypothetical protein
MATRLMEIMVFLLFMVYFALIYSQLFGGILNLGFSKIERFKKWKDSSGSLKYLPV